MSTKLFQVFVKETQRMYKDRKGKRMKFPSTVMVPPYVQDAMQRCADEARFFGVRDNREELVQLAYCLHIRDRLAATRA